MRVAGVGMCVCGVGGILILDRRLGCCVAGSLCLRLV